MPDWLKIDSFDKWRDVLILIPSLHLIACFVYLFFYYYSFGHGLIYFASPSEVFSVSLSEVGTLYLFGGTGILLGLWLYESDAEIDERYSEKSRPVIKKLNSWQIKFVAFSSFVIALLGLVASIRAGYTFWPLFQLLLIVVMASFVGYHLGRKGYTRSFSTVVSVIGFAVISISINGLADGQNAAKLEYSSFSDRPTCGEYRILKDVSDKFLAITENNDRWIISEKCEPAFSLIDGKEVKFFKDPSAVSSIASIWS